MSKTALELSSIAASGGCLEIEVGRHTSLELSSIAASCQRGGGTLRLLNANRLTSLECSSIANAAPGRVTFVL
jgi:hypothetical protein